MERRKGLKEKGEGGRKEKRKEAIKDEKGKKNWYSIYTQIFIIADFYLFVNIYFLNLAVLGLSCGTWDLSFFNPGLRHWTIREVPQVSLYV